MNCKMCTYIAVTNVVMHGYFFLVKIDILSLHVPMFMISKSTVPVPYRYNFLYKLEFEYGPVMRIRICGSGFVSGLWIRIRMDPHSFSLMDPDPHSICGSGSRRGKFEGII